MWVETSLLSTLVAVSARGVCFVSLTPARAEADLAEWVERRRPRGEADGALLRRTAERLREVADGSRQVFELPLDLRGTEFQRSVWAELLRIPFGETRTYGDLARRLGKPGASRAVGGANGANPVPWIVPCHRVVAIDSLGGFTSGLENKVRLLAHEGVAGVLACRRS
ncbi:MAG: cysteine methyltransferase [Planctomycetes bacterium]|jgi:O-6-methylguanine DNA methyltransferase|nr:cysteine methyltransferase [Planctomycetota bacterium]